MQKRVTGKQRRGVSILAHAKQNKIKAGYFGGARLKQRLQPGLICGRSPARRKRLVDGKDLI